MELKNIEEVLKLQKDFAAKLSENVKVLHGKRAPSLNVVIKEKEALLKQIRKDQELAVKERARFISRMDERIEQYSKNQTQLEIEIKKLQDSLKPPTRGKQKTKNNHEN